MNQSIETIQVAVGVIIRRREILLSRRHRDSHLGGSWEFPGGKLEAGETAKQTVAREILEEVGLEVRVGECFHYERHEYPERLVHISFFFCDSVDDREPQALEVREWKWVRTDQLTSIALPPANRLAVEKVISTLAPGI